MTAEHIILDGVEVLRAQRTMKVAKLERNSQTECVSISLIFTHFLSSGPEIFQLFVIMQLESKSIAMATVFKRLKNEKLLQMMLNMQNAHISINR